MTYTVEKVTNTPGRVLIRSSKIDKIFDLPPLSLQGLSGRRRAPGWIDTQSALATDTITGHYSPGDQGFTIKNKQASMIFAGRMDHHKIDGVGTVQGCNNTIYAGSIP